MNRGPERFARRAVEFFPFVVLVLTGCGSEFGAPAQPAGHSVGDAESRYRVMDYSVLDEPTLFSIFDPSGPQAIRHDSSYIAP